MISSFSNERIKAARKLHSRQHRHRAGRLLLEGARLIGDAMRSGFDPVEIYFSPEVVSVNREAAQLVDSLQERSVRCTPVSQQVLASLAETITPQGVVAVMDMPDLPAPSQPSLTLVLDGVADPGNAGTLLRSAEAAGVDLAVFAPGTVDAYNEKVVRAGMGAHFRLPLCICMEWDQVRSAFGEMPQVYVADARAAAPYDAVDWRKPSVLIVGSEAHGPSQHALGIATPVSIPMHGPVESLNAAMAGTIILFEAARQRKSYVQAQR